jgi:hypothetical protein
MVTRPEVVALVQNNGNNRLHWDDGASRLDTPTALLRFSWLCAVCCISLR